ncbi:ATP-binding protein [Neorhodopirellula lusitana]|uniref:ATP-binding protein n=1 Tax=Neorhodopirellula lusitana TaxID=445327 RepID=UPI003850BA3E
MKSPLKAFAKLYNRIPIRLRLSFGLVGLMTGSLLVASAAGFFPNEQEQILRGRARVCETLAISSTAMASSGQLEALKVTLESVVHRDPQIKSIGLVNTDGGMIVSAGQHEATWQIDPTKSQPNAGTQMEVPVFRYGDQWGELQVAFESTGGLFGLNYWAPAWLLIVLIPACFVQFAFFLGKTLRSLDPSGAVPTHVEKALDTFTVGLVLLNADQRILFANKRLTQLLDVSSKDLVGKYVADSQWIIPESGDQSPANYPWIDALETQESVLDRILQMDVNGRRLTFTVNCTPITGQGFLTTFDDITLIEENKVALAEARDAAQNANEAKSEFLANMSHEIRTPLNAVLGFTDVLRRGLVTDTEESVGHLNMIHRSGSHLLELINDILDLSKIEAGHMEVESIPTQVDSVMSDVAKTLQVRADEAGLDLHLRLESAIPREIPSDPTRLRQVITNLVGNAIKFTQEGSVSIIAAMRSNHTDVEHNESGDSVSVSPYSLRIDIVDTGIGMSRDQQSRIFESFAQADSTTTRKFGGTGLGLSISRRLAEALGGSLTVESQPGFGSTFRVEIPINASDAEDLISPSEFEEANRRKFSGAASADLIRLPAKRVLVVDDGEANRKLIELVLSRAGAEVVTACNGQEAIDSVNDELPAMIFMDMQMPVLDGYAATEKLRSFGCKVPIAALTGNAMVGDREKCIDCGCDDFLPKPINLDQLMQLASKHLGPADAVDHSKRTLPPASTADAIEFAALKEQQPSTSDDLNLRADGAQTSRPIHPTLPMDDPDFREITSGFLDRLPARLDFIEAAIQKSDFEALEGDAHWLKGAGGTVGLDVFTEPSRKLESAAKEHEIQIAQDILRDLRDLASRVVIPPMPGETEGQDTGPTNDHAGNRGQINDSPASSIDSTTTVDDSAHGLPTDGTESRSGQDLALGDNPSSAPDGSLSELNGMSADGGPVHCSLPIDDPDFRDIVIGFIERLDQRIAKMEDEISTLRFDDLALSAHWLKGAGGTVGYGALTVPAQNLLIAAKANDIPSAREHFQAIVVTRSRMIVPNPTTI